MPLDQPPSPVSPPPAPLVDAAVRRAQRATLAVMGLAIVMFMALGAARLADPAWTSAGALAILAVGAYLATRAARHDPDGVAAPVDGPAPVASAGEAQTYALALELAPNPVLLVSGEDPDDIVGRRIIFANAEARETLRLQREGAFLVTVVRHPGVLEAIDEALFGRTARTLSYETGGPQDRSWRVWTKPLPATESHARLALVIMRDETDVRLNERMRADFLANASHELRTPLASLAGFIETLRGHARDDVDARERFLLIMSRQAERMARLIDDLLSLSRIELNEHIRPAGACDLALAVNDVADALAPQIMAKGVRLALNLPAPGVALVIGDRDQLVQVIQNLLDNAVKYSPAGGVVRMDVTAGVSLEAASASNPDDARLNAPGGGRMPLLTPVRTASERYAVLRVDDSGPGMAREHLPRLTERFYRVEGQKSGERSGTGLGLAIVKHILNRHRGGFLVQSAPGEGASFCIYLPMSAKAAAEPAATPPLREKTPA